MKDLVNYLRRTIPLTQHIDIQAGELSDEWLELQAPQAPNLNDKLTTFGGSLATLCTLSGWCVVSKLCQQHQLDADISVVDSQIAYRLPVVSDPIKARAFFPAVEDSEQLFGALKKKGKAFITIQSRVFMQEQEAVIFSSTFHVTLRSNPIAI